MQTFNFQVEAMYKIKEVKDIADHPTFYEDALNYWQKVDPSVEGMMGGLDKLSSIDLTSSMQFVFSYVQVRYIL